LILPKADGVLLKFGFFEAALFYNFIENLVFEVSVTQKQQAVVYHEQNAEGKVH
jgi:hypothetical protein